MSTIDFFKSFPSNIKQIARSVISLKINAFLFFMILQDYDPPRRAGGNIKELMFIIASSRQERDLDFV